MSGENITLSFTTMADGKMDAVVSGEAMVTYGRWRWPELYTAQRACTFHMD